VCLQEHPQSLLTLYQRLQTTQDNASAQEAVLSLAVDEFLRYESSNQLGNRRAVKACEVGGVALPAGALVTLCIRPIALSIGPLRGTFDNKLRLV